MDTRTIKGIREEKWRKLKEIAARRRVSMGEAVENMIDNYEERNETFWDEILSGEAIISEKESEELRKSAEKIRKGWRMRN